MNLKDKTIFLCAICNINSGTCYEDCKFCSQSVRYKADIQRYKQKSIDLILDEATQAYNNGALGFCLVTSHKALDTKILDFVSEIAKTLKKVLPNLRLIACNGTATTQQLKILKQNGIDAYNHNLETSQKFYPSICTTHSWEERYQTCKNVNEAGLVLISGGIFGLRETQEDRIDMLKSLQSLNPTSVPINFYHHNPALELQPNPLSYQEALSLIQLTRDMIPNAQRIMVAGGRELIFGQTWTDIFDYGANSIVIGNYLTTKGENPNSDLMQIEKAYLTIAKKV